LYSLIGQSTSFGSQSYIFRVIDLRLCVIIGLVERVTR
jgi:hypothetical protein